MIGWLYLAGFAITWIAALTHYVKSECDGDTEDMDLFDWCMGSLIAFGCALIFPVAAVAIVPIVIVKHLSKKNRDSF